MSGNASIIGEENANADLQTTNKAVLNEVFESPQTSSASASPETLAAYKNIPNRKRKREETEHDIAQCQREILSEIKKLSSIQTQLLNEIKIRNEIERQKLELKLS